MEKALQKAHGVGYEVYRRSHAIRVKIEKCREQEYIKSLRISADIERHIHRENMRNRISF